ncbi:guanine nucleotide-binding protein subunit alpha [Phanerochaete sordida]|uniref:Guanine nucleotide-binding protein subunit alpha n=1 Tax=Phanerochaete sordida TaxID=48140 RepID=A0A9P3LC79_9APHY|nr:guanine nucleotide-binding protein subunit alpha [Phanerochaete sordida]
MISAPRPPSVRSIGTDYGDPITAVLRPPVGETENERQLRLQREAEAKRISDAIDEELRAEEKRYRKRKEDVRLLLLGQAESGKSTLQKQFQLMYNPTSLEEERLSWRPVVYYNIARPVRRIFEVVDAYGEFEDDDDAMQVDTNDDSMDLDMKRDSTISGSQGSSTAEKRLATLRYRLGPLLAAEASLAERLSGGQPTPTKGNLFVRSGWQARSLLGKARLRERGNLTGPRASMESGTPRRSEDSTIAIEKDKLIEDVAKILHACSDDIKELWEHPVVQRLREKRRLRLEEWAEFFLDNISRVSESGFVPTTDDILHARIQTMGVAEHIFDVSLHGRTVTWHLYDVGGARGQRHTWAPYFDDASAIIFMAPVSAFDQYLEEDPRTNRIDDSLQLFTQICSNKLLKNAHLVLFLNKTDVLRAKLARGVQVKKYITSYGERPNEFDSVVGYFRAHFTQVHKRNNENMRVLYTHLTNVVDKTATQRIITDIRDSIFRVYLKDAALV